MTGFPGPITAQALKRGIPIFRNGLRFDEEMQRATSRGYRSARQIVIDRAEGDFIWDLDGKRYIDFQNGWATNPVGNAHPEIIEAVDTANRRYGFHYDHPLRYELAERLAETMPGRALPRFNYEVSGTEAAEAAVHLALTHMERRYVIAFSSAYHGFGLGSKLLSAYGDYSRYLEAWSGGVIRAPYPYSDSCPADMTQEQYVEFCLWYLDRHIPMAVTPKDTIAAILIEPGLAEGGNWIPPANFLKGIRQICDNHDWLMIADEVLTGLGRTGRMWAVEHYDVIPDIMVVGKNLSGGIAPCAGIAARDDILGDARHFNSGSTFAGTPAGCAAGLKTLELYDRYGLVENAARLGAMAKQKMANWTASSLVREIRTNGLLMGVSFQSPDDARESWMYARSVKGQMLENGVWAISDQEENVRMYPALNMDPSTLMHGLDVMENAIRHVEKEGPDEGNTPLWPTSA